MSLAVRHTDRERVLLLEARVAELEEELACWRGNQADDADERVRMERAIAIKARLQRYDRRCAFCATNILIRLMDEPGVTFTKQQLLDASRHPGAPSDHEPDLKIVDVQVNFLRRALDGVGLRPAIETVWGIGYRTSPANAERLKAVLEPEHG